MLTDRRKRQLISEGVDVDKIEKMVPKIIQELRAEHYTLQEAEILFTELAYALPEIENTAQTPAEIFQKKWEVLKKKVADLEVQVQSQQEQLKAGLTPPVNGSFCSGRNTYHNRNCLGGNTGGSSGGGIDYNSLTVETLRNINYFITDLRSVFKNG